MQYVVEILAHYYFEPLIIKLLGRENNLLAVAKAMIFVGQAMKIVGQAMIFVETNNNYTVS